MAVAARELPDWEAGPVVYPWSKKLSLLGLLVLPIALIAVVLGFVGGGWMSLLGAAALGALWIVAILAFQGAVLRRGSIAQRGLKTLDDDRFASLVHGLAADHGIAAPELLVIEEGGPNAVVVRRPRARLAVSRSLLETYTRTELEAVAAHSLVRLASGHLTFAHLASALGRWGSRFAPRVGFEEDVHAAALTRYPPALAAAIAKAEPATGATGPFWFVAHDRTHRSPAERISALQQL